MTKISFFLLKFLIFHIIIQTILNKGELYKFWSKIGIVVKKKFCAKIRILVKNRTFGQKSKFWPKLEILVKTRNCGQKEIFDKHKNIGQKLKFWTKIEVCRNQAEKCYF